MWKRQHQSSSCGSGKQQASVCLSARGIWQLPRAPALCPPPPEGPYTHTHSGKPSVPAPSPHGVGLCRDQHGADLGDPWSRWARVGTPAGPPAPWLPQLTLSSSWGPSQTQRCRGVGGGGEWARVSSAAQLQAPLRRGHRRVAGSGAALAARPAARGLGRVTGAQSLSFPFRKWEVCVVCVCSPRRAAGRLTEPSRQGVQPGAPRGGALCACHLPYGRVGDSGPGGEAGSQQGGTGPWTVVFTQLCARLCLAVSGLGSSDQSARWAGPV